MLITEYQNPFNLVESKYVHELPPGMVFGEWMSVRYRGFENYISAVSLNGRAFSSEDWYRSLSDDDDIRVMLKPGIDIAVASLVLSIISVAATALTPEPVIPEIPEESPTYSLRGQRNQVRLGSGVPAHYGHVRVWPDLIAQPYTQYFGNDQFLYQLFCIGLGEYDLGPLHIGETDVSAYEEITYEAYYNQPVTLFPTEVVTSSEPANEILTDQNFTNPIVCSGVGTQAVTLEVDLVFPKGLYEAKADGHTAFQSADILIQYQEIDDNGDPVSGQWLTFAQKTISEQTRSPLRTTHGKEVPPGRYQVRMKREDPQGQQLKVNEVVWEGMRAFLVDGAPTFNDMTVLAVKAKATEKLNSNSQQKFNLEATRKLPSYDSSTGQWSDEATATSSIAWALADLVTNDNLGGQSRDDLDITALEKLRVIWEGDNTASPPVPDRGDRFNYRFDTKITVWEAIKVAARAGRAYPIINGQTISFVRTGPQQVASTLFNRTNIVKNSFKIEYKFRTEESHDSIMAEFIDPTIGWQKNVVLCQPPGSAGSNPKKVHLNGITNRDQAFREGIYQAEALLKQKKTARFRTELEGYIPNRGDLVKIVNENFDMDQGGEIVAVNGNVLTVSEPLEWLPTLSYKILLRKDNGEVDGPHDVTEGVNEYQCVLASALSWAPYTGGEQERSKYQFGVSDSTIGDWVVAEIRPQGGNIVELVCVNEVPSVHTVDSATPPADNSPTPLLLPTPEITYLNLTNSPPTVVNVTWSQPLGAASYEVEKSLDGGVNWHEVPVASKSSTSFEASPGAITVRVRGITEDGQSGPWKVAQIDVQNYVTNSPVNLSLTSELMYLTSGDYQTNVVFEFDPPANDVYIREYEVEYKLARHNDWQALYKGTDTRFEFAVAELGLVQVRARSVYVLDEVFSEWAEVQMTSLGTDFQLAQATLKSPDNPKLFLSLDSERNKAKLRIEVGYDRQDDLFPEDFVLFYAIDDQPNALQLGDDLDSRLVIEDVNVEGDDWLPVVAGSTSTSVAFSDPQNKVDINLSGMWWVSIHDSGSNSTRYHKVSHAESGRLHLNASDEFEFVASSGDQIHIIEISYHDSRMSDFKFAWIDGEVIHHNGIKFDDGGNYYYIDVVSRGAEGTSQANQSGKELQYFPAPGAGTSLIPISFDKFNYNDATNVATYSGNIDVNIPSEIPWAALSCCFVRKSTTPETVAYVRSDILPLTVSS